MGTTFSHPLPLLVEINGPGNKVLVPGPFTVHPYSSSRGGRASYTPVYQRVHSPARNDRRPRGRPRDRGRRRLPSEDTMTMSEMSFESGMEEPRRRGLRPSGGTGRGGVGMSPMRMPVGGRRPLRRSSRPPTGGYVVDPMDMRTHSTPNLVTGYGCPAGRTPLQAGLSQGAGQPVYGGGMGAYPYAAQQGQTFPINQGQTPLFQQPQRSLRPSGLNEIPMGAYTAGAAPPSAPLRAKTEPPTSSRLNRKQPPGRNVGPSGQAWIEGDPFLDGCTCTTNCTCRKGQRVFYRSQAQDGDGQKGWGEIRYVLKDDLGRDCGDHSKCQGNGHDEDDSSEVEKKTSKTKKGKSKKRVGDKDEFHEMRDRINAIQEDLAGMKLQDRNTRPGMRTISPYASLPNHHAAPGMTEGREIRLPPHYESTPFGMGASGGPPPGMGGRARPGRMPRPGLPGPGMRPGMDFAYDDMPYSESAYGVDDLMSPMELGGRPPRPRQGGGRRAMPPDIASVPNPRRSRGPGGPRNLDLGMPWFGRGRRQRGGGGRRRPTLPPPTELEDDAFPVGLGMRGGMGGHAGGPRDDYGETGDDDEHATDWEDQDDGEGGRMRHSPLGQGGNGGGHVSKAGNAGRQARVEDDEDDMNG